MNETPLMELTLYRTQTHKLLTHASKALILCFRLSQTFKSQKALVHGEGQFSLTLISLHKGTPEYTPVLRHYKFTVSTMRR